MPHHKKKKIKKVIGRIKKFIPIQKMEKDSLRAKFLKEDEQAFKDDPTLAGFVREYVPGEFPEGSLTEEELKNTKYVLIKRSERTIGMELLGKYPLTQSEFEYYQQDPSRMEELEPVVNSDDDQLYQVEE